MVSDIRQEQRVALLASVLVIDRAVHTEGIALSKISIARTLLTTMLWTYSTIPLALHAGASDEDGFLAVMNIMCKFAAPVF